MKYLFFFGLILCICCQSEQDKTNVIPVSAEEVKEKQSPQVSEVIGLEILTNSNWLVEIVLDNGKINPENDWKGSTLSFDRDGSYEWKGEGIDGYGKFELDTEKNMILLTATDPTLNSEWSIKQKKNVMVWIGTPKYGHHSLQMKLVGKTKED